MVYTSAECGTLRLIAASEPRNRPSTPSRSSVRLRTVAYGTGAPGSTCLIHLSRCTGCLAYVAAKPETAPEMVVSYHLALLGAGGELAAAAAIRLGGTPPPAFPKHGLEGCKRRT